MIYNLDDPKIRIPFPKAPNFTPWEFRCKDKENTKYSGPCTDIIKVDHRLVEMLQKMRVNIGRAVVITSGYRSATYNDFVNGSKSSRHILGHAADVAVKDVAPDIVATYAYMAGFRRIGIANSFTHVDTGPGNAIWAYPPLNQNIVDNFKNRIKLIMNA